jgi:hypothetical protein
MKGKNSTLNDFFERENQTRELKKAKQLIRRYIEEVTFEQVRDATLKQENTKV